MKVIIFRKVQFLMFLKYNFLPTTNLSDRIYLYHKLFNAFGQLIEE